MAGADRENGEETGEDRPRARHLLRATLDTDLEPVQNPLFSKHGVEPVPEPKVRLQDLLKGCRIYGRLTIDEPVCSNVQGGK
jgi:hypothetical protein